jgi:tRNA modification GTPase
MRGAYSRDGLIFMSWASSVLYGLAMMNTTSTIFALSSGPGRAGVAVLRVSGSRAGAALQALAGGLAEARQAVVRALRDPVSGALLDQALVLWFPGPKSFTGEDCCELHIHGGRAVVSGVLGALGRIEGLRLAEPGEFTRRAFENGKLDLTQAEGLADLIDAETEAQRQQALRQMGGALRQAAERWREWLVRAMALTEAAIDFSDEGDVSAKAVGQAREIICGLVDELQVALADGHRGEILRDGFPVAILGPPNAGKSSLLNALSRRDVAIVSDEPGTTRDVVEVRLDLHGIPVLFMDTAGLREAPGKVEREGIRRALKRAEEAQLVLWVVDALAPLIQLPGELQGRPDQVLRVLNKVDTGARIDGFGLQISTVTGEGIPALLDEIARRAADATGANQSPLVTRARHRTMLDQTLAGCRAFLDGRDEDTELRAEDLRRAAHALGRLTGRVDVEEVLGEIFGRFCIGK